MITEIEVLALDADALAREVERHNRLYWTENRPAIPDTLYDFMVERLRTLAPTHPLLDALDGTALDPSTAPADPAPSPDESASTSGTRDEPVRTAGGKVVHARPMLSLEKCYAESDLLAFYDRIDGEALATHKIDGLALSLRYDADGALQLAATRGDGRRGDDVTANAAAVTDIPTSIPPLGVPVEVRGEVYLPLARFRSTYQGEFANPRNLAAGALKQKDPERTRAYGLRFFAYDMHGPADLATERASRERLADLGFLPVPGRFATRDEGQATFEALAADRETLDFETDGIVFRANDRATQQRLGENAHHPRWAIAYKYQGESGFSTLRSVEWSVSRTGAINPVAHVDPVILSGVVVSRASLHNLGIIESLASKTLEIGANDGFPLSAGARLLLTRRGGVIPHVEAILEPGTGALEVPAACPSCGAATERRDDVLFAAHTDACAVQRRRALLHFGAVMDIQGLGPKLMEQLDALDLVTRPSDLYRLRAEDLESLERFGRKSSENLISAINVTRRVAPARLLAALGIPDLGPRQAETLLEGTGSLDALRNASVETLTAIHGIGPAIAASVVAGLDQWREELDRLLAAVELDVEATLTARPADEGPLAGLSFVFTGELASMKRKEAQERVRALGAATPSDVNRETRYVVIGDEDFARYQGGWRSSKLKKAEKLAAEGAACEVIGEAAFLAMLRGNDGSPAASGADDT